MSGLEKGDAVVVRDPHHGRRRAIVEDPAVAPVRGGRWVFGPPVRVRYEDNGACDWRHRDEVEPC